jgi:uncharacterized membrane protein
MPSFLKGRSLYIALSAAGIAYPFLVYFGLRVVSPTILVVAVLGVLVLKVIFNRHNRLQKLFGPVSSVAGAGVLLMVILSPMAGLKAYPILMSLGWAGLFAFSLIRPPTIIERIARLREPDLPPSAIPYLRNVTLVWLGFFLINALISTTTAISGSLELWALYNGLISYILMGALFAGEFIIRCLVRRRHGAAA